MRALKIKERAFLKIDFKKWGDKLVEHWLICGVTAVGGIFLLSLYSQAENWVEKATKDFLNTPTLKEEIIQKISLSGESMAGMVINDPQNKDKHDSYGHNDILLPNVIAVQ